MIIYLEGPDGSGKSTLLNDIANHIHDKFKVDIIRNANQFIPTHPKADHRINETLLFYTLRKLAKDDKAVYIIDRGPISDLVYRVFDSYDWVTTPNKVIEFFKKYSNKIMTIYCRTDLAEKKMLERGDENPIAIEKHKEITKLFDLFMSSYKDRVKYNVIRHDYSKKSSTKQILSKVDYFCYMNGCEEYEL